MSKRNDASQGDAPLLVVEGLGVAVSGNRPVLEDVSLELTVGDSVGLIGESGSGKTMLCRALTGMLQRRGGTITSGSIKFRGRELVGAPEATWRDVRGRQIGYIPQSSLAGLNPLLTVGTQLMEVLAVRDPAAARSVLRRRALDLLGEVRIREPERVIDQRSLELSGGMKQRVLIAAAIAHEPVILIADEPTTALDVTIQRDILLLLRRIQDERQMTLALISHDLSVIERVCDRLMVMYAGSVVETGPLSSVMSEPLHPYTRALRDSRLDVAPVGSLLPTILGEPPSVGRWPGGCRFGPRCSMREEACGDGQPRLVNVGHHQTACLRWNEMGGQS